MQASCKARSEGSIASRFSPIHAQVTSLGITLLLPINLSLDDSETQSYHLCVCSSAGSALLTAGYCLYSSSTIFVLTTGKGVYGFTLDPLVGEFILSHDNVKV